MFPLNQYLFPYSLNAFKRSLFISCCCSPLKTAYPNVPKNLFVGLRKVRRLISYIYIGGYSAGAGLSLARDICERSHVLLEGKIVRGTRMPSCFGLCSIGCMLHGRFTLTPVSFQMTWFGTGPLIWKWGLAYVTKPWDRSESAMKEN